MNGGADRPSGYGGADRPSGYGGADAGDSGFDGFSSPDAALRARAQAARLLYPELRELPDEDAVAVVLGGGMLGAYAGFRAREAARFRQETDRRGQENSLHAPVRGVAGGNPQTRGRDLFEQGFDEDGW